MKLIDPPSAAPSKVVAVPSQRSVLTVARYGSAKGHALRRRLNSAPCVAEDDLADAVGQARGEESVSHAGDCFQPCAADRRSQGLAVRQGPERVCRAVDDERGCGDIRQRDEAVGCHQQARPVVIGGRSEVCGPVVGSLDEASCGRLVEGQDIAVQDAPGLQPRAAT